MYYELKTDRLLLRPLAMEDLELYHSYASDKDNTTYMYYLPYDTVEETRQYLRRVADEWQKEQASLYEFAVMRREEQIGTVSVTVNDGRTDGELAWIIDKRHWKNGYASEAAAAVLYFAVNELKLLRVFACCDYRNKGSYRLMKKIGLTLENDDGIRIYPKTAEKAREIVCSLTVPVSQREAGKMFGEGVHRDGRPEFLRTELLLGAAGMERLKSCTVAVFGIGGVGSHLAEALARSGVGRLILVDNDNVSLTNINRQSVAWHSTVGMKKTEVMKRRIADICPDTKVLTFDVFVLTDNLEALFSQAGKLDYIVDAIDTVTAKISLAVYAKEHNIPFIASMGTGNKLYPSLFEIADISETSVCPLCRVMRKELKNRGIDKMKVLYSKEQPITPDRELEEKLIREELSENSSRRSIPGSISFVPPVAGLLIAGEVVRELAGVSK